MPNLESSLGSPVDHYRPGLLMLAPEGGEDLSTKSLVSQLLELSVPLELDADWHLPTAPPKDLSAYRACLIPETARERYDADLNAYYRAGGFVFYLKYYPVGPPDAGPSARWSRSIGSCAVGDSARATSRGGSAGATPRSRSSSTTRCWRSDSATPRGTTWSTIASARSPSRSRPC